MIITNITTCISWQRSFALSNSVPEIFVFFKLFLWFKAMNMLFALSTFKLFNMVFNPSHSQLHWFTLCPCRVHCNHIWLTWCLVPYEVGLVPVANNYPSNNLHCPVLQWCLNLWSIHYCFSTAFPTDNVSVIPWSYW